MDTINVPKQNDWANNVYVVSTTRILIGLGLIFLIRSFHQLYQRMTSSGRGAGVRGESRVSSCC